MSEMTFDSAAAALSDAAAQDAASEGSYVPTVLSDGTPNPAASQQSTTTTGGDGTPGSATPQTTQPGQAAPTPDTFTNIDPASLSPELQAIYRNMQADYTRKTQEIAPYRQLAGAGVDPNRAVEAVQFMDAMENDPNFVVAVHQQLSEALEQAGLTQAEASAEATRQIQSGELFEGGDESEGESPLAQEVAELRAWKEQQEMQQLEQNMAADLQRAEMAIRQQNPHYTDSDIERIYELGFAYGGNLLEAQQSYEAWRNSFAESFVAQKGAAPPAQPPVASAAAHTEQPADEPISWDQARVAARSYLKNVLGS